ncbi:hypothetical protein [Azospirillum sp. sgz301742]
MNVANIARRLAAGEFHYALGRFGTVRRGYSLMRGLSRRDEPPLPPASPPTLFPKIDASEAARTVQRDSVAFGFDLPAPLVEELNAFARAAALYDRGLPRPFHHDEVTDGRLSDGTPVVLGLIPEPRQCAGVRRICGDPVLLEAITDCLGYRPTKLIPRLFWSFATAMDEDERRRRGQTIDWHFDVHDFNFCSACFYLSDVTERTGAHALVRGSHHSKPLRFLVGSANVPQDEVFAHFGAERAMIIEGPAGTGFIEDTSCFHRAMPPMEGERLMMQIWFS